MSDKAAAVPVPLRKDFSKQEKKQKKTSSFNLSPRMLPPLTRRKNAIYELINMRREDPRITEGPRMVEIPPFQLSPIYEIYDRFEEDMARATKVMVYSNKINVTEYYNMVDSLKNTSTTPSLDMPEFINGQVMIDVESEYTKYVWWELHPLNGSNKFRDKTKPALFKRVDIEFSSPYLQLMKMDMKLDAEKYVIGLDSDKLQQLGAAFGMSTTTMSMQDLRLDLRLKAQRQPEEILFKSPENHATQMRNVISGMSLGILDYRPETQEYFFEDNQVFFQVPLEQPPLESLAKFLASEKGIKERATLEEKLAFWN